MGAVWPNGHQDRLRRASVAWAASADGFAARRDEAILTPIAFAADRLPEADDMIAACRAMAGHLDHVAAAHRQLAHSCADLAAHLDQAHAAVGAELASLLAWSAGIEGVGALCSVVSLGAAEVPTQGVEAARIAASAARIGSLLARFASAARSVAATIPTATEIADTVSLGLRRLLGTRLAVAQVETVRALPAATRAATTIERTEMAADEGASGAAEGVLRFAERDAARFPAISAWPPIASSATPRENAATS